MDKKEEISWLALFLVSFFTFPINEVGEKKTERERDSVFMTKKVIFTKAGYI